MSKSLPLRIGIWRWKQLKLNASIKDKRIYNFIENVRVHAWYHDMCGTLHCQDFCKYYKELYFQNVGRDAELSEYTNIIIPAGVGIGPQNLNWPHDTVWYCENIISTETNE